MTRIFRSPYAPTVPSADYNAGLEYEERQRVQRAVPIPAVEAVSASRTLTGQDDGVLFVMDATAGVLVLTLPLANSVPAMTVGLKKIDSGTNTAGFARTAPDTIDGAASNRTSTQYATIWVRSNGIDTWEAYVPAYAGSATKVDHDLTAGSHLSGGPYNGSAAVTLDTDGTPLNTVSTLVARDGSGNFAAGTMTGNVSGNAGTVTNGVYTTGSYSDPSWLTAVAAAKILAGTLGTGQFTLTRSGTGDNLKFTNAAGGAQSGYLYTSSAYTALANGASLTGQAVALTTNTTELFVGGVRVAYVDSAGLYSAGDLGVVGQLQERTGAVAWKSGNVQGGGLAQQSGLAVGFDIFTPSADYGVYRLSISGKDAGTGSAPSNVWFDEVVLVPTAGWSAVTMSSTTVLGTPGARTYTNSTGNVHLALASGMTWYVDILVTKFDA